MSDDTAQPTPAYAACVPYTGAVGIAPDPRAVAEFFRSLPHLRFVVAMLNPEAKRAVAFSFGRGDIEANAQGIAQANAGGWNAYFRPNGYAPGATFTGNSHPEKLDVYTGFVSHIDADAPHGLKTDAERQAWCASKAKELEADGASYVWFTGGGVQAIKLLGEPILLGPDGMAHEEFEEANVAWANARGGDHCHDCSHLLRVPASINWPDARKVKRGRVPTLGRMLASHPDRRVDWASLPRERPKSKPKAQPAGTTGFDTTNPKRLTSVDDLGRDVSELCKLVIVNGEDPSKRVEFPSRSEALFWVACELARSGEADEAIFAAITNPEWKISESVLDKGSGAERYAIRQIERARDEASDDPVSTINRQYFAAIEGSRLSYYREEIDASVTPMNAEAFAFELAPHKVEVADAKGNTRRVPALDIWKSDSRRRFYPRGFVLDPTFTRDEGRYNLWRGFGVVEAPGDWDIIRNHVEEVLADGNAEYADYILRWTAWKLQHPAEPPRVALAFRGGEGIGKGFWHNGLVRIFGHHGLRVHSMVQVAGRFNAHMRHLCYLFADEVSVVDDEQEGALKGIITEPTLPIEGKGKDIIQADNHLAVGMASNRQWMVPAGIGARRFAVFNVSEKRKGDGEYFSNLFGHAQAGGWGAMLYELRRWDLGNWQPEAHRPATEALAEQQVQTLRGIERVLVDCLLAGEIPHGEMRGEKVFVPTLRFCEFVGQRTRGEPPSYREAGRLFDALGFEKDDTARPRGWVLPPLNEARAVWDRTRIPLKWSGTGEGWSVGLYDYREAVPDAF